MGARKVVTASEQANIKRLTYGVIDTETNNV